MLLGSPDDPFLLTKVTGVSAIEADPIRGRKEPLAVPSRPL